MEKQRTHIEVPKPEISVRYLADFMDGSERKRRSVVEGCKYRPIAKLVQHKEAASTISNAIQNGPADPKTLKDKADFIRKKLSDDDFEALVNEVNADYVEKFSEVVASIKLPAAEFLPGKSFPPVLINGVRVRFSPHLLLHRIDKTNKPRRGAFMLRYAKGKALAAEVGGFQSAAAFGLLRDHIGTEGGEPDKSICVTLDAFTGEIYTAPGASASMFANMKAACMTIAERWPNIKPPKNAVL